MYIMKFFASNTPNPELMDRLVDAAKSGVPASDLYEQRVSFIESSVGTGTGVTRKMVEAELHRLGRRAA